MTGNETILDESFNESPPRNKWKLALQSILILTVGLLLTMPFQKNMLTVLGQYLAMILALYFFIKKINYKEIKVHDVFLWSTFIIFISYFSLGTLNLMLFNVSTYDPTSYLIGLAIGTLFRSVIFGNMLSIGVFHLIKNKNWSMLILMILTSWMFQTLLLVDVSIFVD